MSDFDHVSVTASVGIPLCPYGIAYRRGLWIVRDGLSLIILDGLLWIIIDGSLWIILDGLWIVLDGFFKKCLGITTHNLVAGACWVYLEEIRRFA